MAKNIPYREVLYAFMKNNEGMTKKEVIKANSNLPVHQSTLYRWYDLVEQTNNISRKIACGRLKKISNKRTVQSIRKKFNHRMGRSQTVVSRTVGCHPTTVGKILKKYTKVRCYKRQKRPYQTEAQKKSNRPKCRRMYFRYRHDDFIIDDESYFTLSHSTIAGNDRFYSDDISKTPCDVKYKYAKKYESKLLVWLAISPKGVTKPFFAPSGMAINQHTYLAIIQNYLEPFINRYYSSGRYVFWPDLASSHYANLVQNYLTEKKIPFVPKEDNPANLPKARPIEDFWGNLKRKVYEGGWEAKTLKELENRISYCLKKIDLNDVLKHIESVPRRLDTIRRGGEL